MLRNRKGKERRQGKDEGQELREERMEEKERRNGTQ